MLTAVQPRELHGARWDEIDAERTLWRTPAARMKMNTEHAVPLTSALARMGCKGPATAHGFRTLFSTCANDSGWNGDIIPKQLAHEERDDVRGAYDGAHTSRNGGRLMQCETHD